MNLVDESGKLLSPTYWTERHTNHTNMTSLMVANTITAAASLFPRRLLDYALPFPAPLGHAFHDHWLALVALATGRIAYVDRSLYDYVQHSANAFGHRGASWKQAGEREGRPGASGACVPTRDRVSKMLLRWRHELLLPRLPRAAACRGPPAALRRGAQRPQASRSEADAERRPVPAACGVAGPAIASAHARAARRPWARSG